MPRSHGVEALCNDDCCLSSVCVSVSDPKSRTKGHRKLKIGRKEDDPWPHLVVKRSLGRLTPFHKIRHIFGTRKATNFKLGIRMEYDDPRRQRARWHQAYNATSSVWHLFAPYLDKEKCRSTKIGRKVLSVSRVTFHTISPRSKGQRSRSLYG